MVSSYLYYLFFLLFGNLLVAQDPAQGLTGIGAGQLGTELPQLGNLVRCQLLTTESIQLFNGNRLTGFQLYESLNCLTALLIGNTNRHGVGNSRMQHEDLEDIARIDVITAGNNHILGAVNNEYITLFIHIYHVTGLQPTVFR